MTKPPIQASEVRASNDHLYQVAFACDKIHVALVTMPEHIAKGLKRNLEDAMSLTWYPVPTPPVTAVSVERIPPLLSPTEFLQSAAEQVMDLTADDPEEHQLRQAFFRHQAEAQGLERSANTLPVHDRWAIELRFVRDFGGAPHDRLVLQRVGVHPGDRAAARRWVGKVVKALEKSAAGVAFEIVTPAESSVVYSRVQAALDALSDQLRAIPSASDRASVESGLSDHCADSHHHPWVSWLREGVEVALMQVAPLPLSHALRLPVTAAPAVDAVSCPQPVKCQPGDQIDGLMGRPW